MQLIQRLKRSNQRGDTVVEVLICIAIISLVLGGAFVLTNRSLQGTRMAQERLNAIKLAESQLDQVKSLASTNPTAIFGATGNFCINNSVQVKTSTDPDCRVNVSGQPTTTQPQFRLAVSRVTNTFTVQVVWDNVKGTQDNVEMKYNVYQ